MFASIPALKPCREILVAGRPTQVLCASDAAADRPERPTGGFLLVFHPGVRLAGIPLLTEAVARKLDPGVRKIAQWEMMQVLIALLAYPGMFRQRAGF